MRTVGIIIKLSRTVRGRLSKILIAGHNVSRGSSIMRTNHSFFKFLIAGFLLALPQFLLAGTSHAQMATAKEQAVLFCTLNRAVSPEAFAFCTKGFLADAEIRKCIEDGSCFGTPIVGLREFSACGSDVNVLHQIFGDKQCGGPKCKGPVGRFLIENKTGKDLTLRTRGKCTGEERLRIAAGERVWHEERAGDDWLWIWGQDIAGPGVKSAAGGTMEGTTNVVGGLWNQNPPHGTWKLVSGRMYRISANQEGRIVPFETTPRFTGRSN